MIMTKKIKFPIGLPLSIFILFGFFAFGAPVSAMTCSSATLAGNVITSTPYYYRLVVTNNYETQGLNIESFTTPACNQPIPPTQNPTASITSTSSCTAPCNVNLSWTSNNIPNLIKIYRNGTFLWNRTANLQNDNEVDWDQPVGTYTYCIRSIDNNWSESGNLACSTTNVTATVVAPPVIVPPLLTMSGILTPASYSCVISTGQNSCNINFSWNTTNPVAVSAVTSSSGTMANGNSSSASFAIPFGSKTFYLYNNAILLDQKTVSANCSSGKTWNGNICQTAPVVVPPVVNPPSYNPPS